MGEKGSNVGQPLVQAGLLGEAIDHAPLAVFVADDEMRYLAVNAFACELLGYSREELLEKTIADLAPPEARTEAAFEEFLAAGDDTGTFPLRRKDGTELVLAYRATTTTVAGISVYVAVGWPVDAPTDG